jgi:hypothetical protein
MVMESYISWDIKPCSPLSVNRALLATFFTLVSCLAYSSTLKMEATYSSEMSVEFQRTIWRYIPEGKTLNNRTVIVSEGKNGNSSVVVNCRNTRYIPVLNSP